MNEAGETILAADGVRVVFFRRGDRYAHRIDRYDPDADVWRGVLESAEGDDDEAWPPSPPLQQLHVERRATGDVVLLVGMAGRTHWSVAVEASADRRGVTFDAAARVQTAPQRLGSRYVRCDGFPSIDVEPPSARREILLLCGNGVSGDGVNLDRLEAGPPPVDRVPTTATWRYEIRTVS